MNRRGFTLVELCVVVVIILTLAGLLVPVVMPARSRRSGTRDEPPQSWNLYTTQHDGHWFVKDAGGGVCHHPDCPCRKQKAEAE